MDVSGYVEDDDVEAFVGDVKGGIEFRRLRLPSEGEFGSAAPLYYKADADSAGCYDYGSWFLTGESRVDAYKPKLGSKDRIKLK